LETQALALRQEWNTYLKEDDAIQWLLKDDAPFTFGVTSRRAASLQGFLKGTRKGVVDIVKRPNTTNIVFLQSAKLKELNAAAIILRAEWLAATDAVWKDHWMAWIDRASSTPQDLIEWIGQVDCEMTLASVAEDYGYVRPHYITPTKDSDAGFSVKDLRHPIIERVRTAAPYIPHSVSFGLSGLPGEPIQTPQGLLVYGVNASGKSSFGKAVGLAILMAQMGCPVPATEMSLIPYNGLYTRILGNDNLWAGMSSFVVEMTEFRSILRSAASRILVIGDELCAGTETASATAIVAAGIQTLVARGAHFLFATHLHELANISEIAGCDAVKAVHLAVHTDPATGVLTYDRTLKTGHGSPMYGLEVCKGLDMDPEFLTRAFEFRKRLFSADGLAHASKYNPAVIVARCEVCGGAQELETHHIVPQAAADKKGKIKPGTHKNNTGNLVVLCSACHDAHHGGMLMIQGWKETTGGRVLEFHKK
jgi:DNA mismatch repair protein MutS